MTLNSEERAALVDELAGVLVMDPVKIEARAAIIREELERVLLEKFGLEDAIAVTSALTALLSTYLAGAWKGNLEGALVFTGTTIIPAIEAGLRAKVKTVDDLVAAKKAIERGADQHGG